MTVNTDRECGGQARLRILLDYISEGSVSISMVYGQFLAQTAIISSNYVMPTPTLSGVVSLSTGNATTSAFGLALLHGLITSWHPFHNKSILKRGRVGVTVDVYVKPHLPHMEPLRGLSHSESSVSISIVLFVANPLDSIMFTLIVHPAQSPLLRAPLSQKRDLLKIYKACLSILLQLVLASLVSS